MNRYTQPELADLLAAEYVLGTLKGRARQRFERLLTEHPSLAAQVEAWELRLNTMAAGSRPVMPPNQVWDGLEKRLFAENKKSSGSAREADVKTRWFENLAFWRGLTLGSGLLAGVLALILLVNPWQGAQPGYVVVLNDKTQEPVWTVSTSADMNRLFVQNLKPLKMEKNQGCMLWVQAPDSGQAYPIGLLPDNGGDIDLDIDAKIRSWLAKGKLMVTVEQKNQAMPPAPTGPLEFSGRLAPLTKI